MRKKLFLLLLAVTMLAVACGFAACGGGDEPSSQSAYYLSVYEGDSWTKYTSDTEVPAASKFVKDSENDDVFTLTVSLEQGDSVKIAQVGSEKVYGGDELLSSLTALTKGKDNAISVAETGVFKFTLDVSDGTITYKFTPESSGSEADVLLVEINESNFELALGATAETKQLFATATLDDDTQTSEGIIWKSSAPTVATVSESGLVTPVAAGTAQITAKLGDVESAPVTCTVTVVTPVTGITIRNDLSVAVESTANLTVGITPADASNKNYTYDITQEGSIISVVKDGDTLAVTGLAAGTATVTVTSEDGNHKASCEVTVVAKGTFTVNISDTSLTLKKASDKTATLSVEVTEDTVESVVWASSADGVATVSGSGEEATVESKGYGTATITATITTASNGEQTKTCTVRVAPEHFFLYGVGSWQGSYADVNSDLIFTNNNDGTYSITAELEKDSPFRIGNDDDFFSAWDGVGYSHIKGSEHIAKGEKDNNLQVDVKGTYTLTVDITGATPKLSITCDAIAISSIFVSADNSTLSAGGATNSATVTLILNPSNATVTASDITWTCESTDVTLVEAADKMSVTVTAKDEAAGGKVTVICTVKGKTHSVDLTITAKGEQVVSVSEITFESTEYTQNVNAAENGGWTTTINAATVNADATNQGVTYSANSANATVSVDPTTGAVTVTASAVGTYTITATAAGDTEKTAALTVTFYSDQFYLTGDDNGWGDVGTATVGKAGYTFTDDGTNKVFTLDTVLTKNAKFQIMYCGTSSWDNALPGAGATVSGDVSVKGNDMIVGGETGFYTITIELSAAKPAVTVTRIGNTPVFTATVADVESDASTVANNIFNMSVVVTLATETKPEIVIKSGDETINTTEYSETLAAGQYRFDIVCSADGKIISATAIKIESPGPVESDEYTLLISGDEDLYDGYTNAWTPTELAEQKLYYDAVSGEYTFYFSLPINAWKDFGFIIREKGAFANALEVWNSNTTTMNEEGKVQVTDVDGNWLAASVSGGWRNMQSSTTGTMYGKVVFKTTEVISITASCSSLNPSSATREEE